MKNKIITISLALLVSLIVIWGVLMVFDWGEEHLSNQQSPQYNELPFEFKLKASPEDVIFSEAYTTNDGRDIVKYAYVAGEAKPEPNEDITRRTPNSYTEVIEKTKSEEGKVTETLKTIFLSKPSFYEKEGKWKQIEYATTTPDIFSISGAIPHIKKRELFERILPGKPVFAITSTFYPDPDAETSSVDGSVYFGAQGADAGLSASCIDAWNNTQPSSSGNSVFDSLTEFMILAESSAIYDDPIFVCDVGIERAIVLFNTSTLSSGASISAATFSLFVQSKNNTDNDGQDTVDIVSSAPASNTGLVVGDYGSLGTTLYATSLDITSVTTLAYLDFTLNSTGVAAINNSGVTKFGVREGHDTANSRVANTARNDVVFYSAENTGVGNDPKLVVTYILSYSFGFWFPF